MAMLLKGAEVAKALTEELHAKTEELKKNGTEPCLAILRVGAREDDLAYERGALKRCEKVGVLVRQVILPEDVSQKELMDNIQSLNEDDAVHGVLMFRPLPRHLDDEAARAALDPKKDMDGICHSRSENLPEICREADILVVAAGKAGMVGAESVRDGQIVLDVGIHVGEDGSLCGDTRFAEVEPIVAAITPVPGGVGTVTSTILASHVVEAAERAAK